MVTTEEINVSSLKMVQEELAGSISRAMTRLEQVVGDQENKELIVEVAEEIQQIAGTFQMVQLHGADMLAREVADWLRDPVAEKLSEDDHLAGHVIQGLFVLSHYLELVQRRRRGQPVLLLPFINDLRQDRRLAPIAESAFYRVPLTEVSAPPSANDETQEYSELMSVASRLRHMYQVGLLALLQGKQVRSSLVLMQRAMDRITRLLSGRPPAGVFYAAGTALEALRADGMEMTRARKLVLSSFDRQFRALCKSDEASLALAADVELVRPSLYLAALADKSSARISGLLESYKLAPLDYCDRDLQEQAQRLMGPGADTVASVATVLQEEMLGIKELLERISEASSESDQEQAEVASGLGKLADILAMVGLSAPSESLREEQAKIRALEGTGNRLSLMDIADALLYVEGTLSGLEGLNLSSEQLQQLNNRSRTEIIASSQLASAELVLIQEAEAGLTSIKQSLGNYAELEYDNSQIGELAEQLSPVRGAFLVLGLPRAAAIVQACERFIDEGLMASDPPAALPQLLETFADAVIGLEYYLDALKTEKDCDDSVLSFAEESLQALGFGVQAA